MATNKARNSVKCAVHCVIYTVAVSLTTWSTIHSWLWSAFIFASHFPVDRWNLADRWLDLINGRSIYDFMINGKKDIPANMDAYNYHALRGGFTALVYAVTDNTMHITIMYYGGKLLWG